MAVGRSRCAPSALVAPGEVGQEIVRGGHHPAGRRVAEGAFEHLVRRVHIVALKGIGIESRRARTAGRVRPAPCEMRAEGERGERVGAPLEVEA